ncbi:hypothetical protein GB937_006773 [Aspergillus fischeri]|nr:hypothetical protein GB937_006773 [Aspergillus fischeri]
MPMLDFPTAAMAETRQGSISCWPMVYILLNTRACGRISAALSVGESAFLQRSTAVSTLKGILQLEFSDVSPRRSSGKTEGMPWLEGDLGKSRRVQAEGISKEQIRGLIWLYSVR